MKRHRGHADVVELAHLGESERIVSQMSRLEIMEEIQRLPDGYRLVFNMHVIEGYSHREIADLLNIQEATSRSQLTKARKMLRFKIEELHTIVI